MATGATGTGRRTGATQAAGPRSILQGMSCAQYTAPEQWLSLLLSLRSAGAMMMWLLHH